MACHVHLWINGLVTY